MITLGVPCVFFLSYPNVGLVVFLDLVTAGQSSDSSTSVISSLHMCTRGSELSWVGNLPVPVQNTNGTLGRRQRAPLQNFVLSGMVCRS